MANENKPPATIDEYISAYPEDVQERLKAMRETIKAAAPEATETLSYGVPTFKLNGNLVSFGAAKKHIGFYPTPAAIDAFSAQLAGYGTAKGSAQFPFDQPLPLELVSEIVKFRVEQVKSKQKQKKK